ncbi:MAG: SAM-dependent methyltransferase [Proteobacteria bacterium]|jgi:SAM-dependent methyltransferase|nr:MAG: SAM-dependent methyltransferase [Pseudomonadota bacterium]
MDPQTLAAYDAGAQRFAAEWHEQPAPTDLQALILRFFNRGRTADIGAGSGREVAWLVASGFPAVGFEPSQGLLAEARRRYPGLTFQSAALPELAGVPDGSFDNVLCETVLMHLEHGQVPASVSRLISLLRPGGVLYLSWRVADTDRRDQHGRLYAAFGAELVREPLRGMTTPLDEETISASSGNRIHRIVACRDGSGG